MTASKIPPEARDFIVRHVDSVEQLDLLMLLRSHSDRDWSADEASQELRSDPASARRKLDELCKAGCLEKSESGRYRFPMSESAYRMLVDAVAAAYREHKYSVIQLIFSKPIDVLSVFSNAFKIKPEDDNHG